MPTWLSWEMLIAGSGALMVVVGVVICAWAERAKSSKRLQPAKRFAFGLLLTIAGLFFALRSYILDSGWGQWIESMSGWLIPLVGTTLMVFGAVLLSWALFADQSRGRKRCPKCWYDMSGAPTLVCPECGKDSKKPAALLRTRRRKPWVLFGLLLALLGTSQFAEPWIRRGAWVHPIPTRALIYALPWYQTQRSRLLWEFASRVIDQKMSVLDSYSSETRPTRLRKLSEPNLALLARRVLDALELPSPHPAREELFDLMPNLVPLQDPARVERLALAALADSNPSIQRSGIVLLRKLKPADPRAAMDGVLGVAGALAGAGSFGLQEGALLEAARFLKESGSKDPRVIPAIISLLPYKANGRSFGGRFDYVREVEVLHALAEIGPDAKAALPLIRPPAGEEDWMTPDPLTRYAVSMIEGTHGDRQRILLDMYLLPEWRFRDFAIGELAKHPPTEDSVATLVYALKDEMNWVRLKAADGLLGLHKEEAAAAAIVYQELDSGSFDAVWQVVDIAGRRKLDLDRVEKAVQSYRENSRVPPGNIENLLRRIAEYRSGELPE